MAVGVPGMKVRIEVVCVSADGSEVRKESVQSCGQVMLREPPEFDQGQAGSLGTNDGMRLPKSH